MRGANFRVFFVALCDSNSIVTCHATLHSQRASEANWNESCVPLLFDIDCVCVCVIGFPYAFDQRLQRILTKKKKKGIWLFRVQQQRAESCSEGEGWMERPFQVSFPERHHSTVRFRNPNIQNWGSTIDGLTLSHTHTRTSYWMRTRKRLEEL